MIDGDEHSTASYAPQTGAQRSLHAVAAITDHDTNGNQ